MPSPRNILPQPPVPHALISLTHLHCPLPVTLLLYLSICAFTLSLGGKRSAGSSPPAQASATRLSRDLHTTHSTPHPHGLSGRGWERPSPDAGPSTAPTPHFSTWETTHLPPEPHLTPLGGSCSLLATASLSLAHLAWLMQPPLLHESPGGCLHACHPPTRHPEASLEANRGGALSSLSSQGPAHGRHPWRGTNE